MDMEGIILSESSQIEKDNIVWYHLHVESEKYNQLENITRKKQIHRYREQTNNFQWGEEEGKGNIRVWEQDVLTVRYKTSYKDILYNMGNTVSIL